MKTEPTLLLIDSKITGFEIGDIAFRHNGINIDSAGRRPSQSMMIFIFLADFLNLLVIIKGDNSKRTHTIIATDSSFKLTLTSHDGNLSIKNENKNITVPFQHYLQALYSDLLTWLDSIQPDISAPDSSLIDFYDALDKLRQLQ